ncbi:MAG: glutamate synthase large subunit, partial [Anaerovoracaceae bacterium]
GAVLDRNGLRPSRYYVTKDGYLILSSEVGVFDIDPSEILLKDRLRPGKMLLVDTRKGEIIDDNDLKMQYAMEHPYGEWLEDNLTHLGDIRIPNKADIKYSEEELQRLQQVFGYSYEDVFWYLKNTAINGEEPIVAMGNDTPLSFLSETDPPLFSYFKQLFAQVTNPPIDAIREEIVTSTHVYLGASGNLLKDSPESCKSIRVRNPILTNTDMLKLKHMKVEGYKVRVIPITYYKDTSLEDALENIFLLTDRAIRDGANILILSDREVDEYHVPVPSLLAVSAVQQHLVRTKNRTQLSLILESGEPREVHHFATLLGYGASAVNPYLALDSIKSMIDNNILDKEYYPASEDYCNGILAGILKIASKMGISTIQSYMGAQIFEAVGISRSVIDKYFTNTVSPIGGICLEDIEKDVLKRHEKAFDPLGLKSDLSLDSIGYHKSVGGKEQHLYNPATIHKFQEAVRNDDYRQFKEYTHMIDEELGASHIRSLMEFDYKQKEIPLSEVESAASIVKRFKVGAMSYGALSLEAHETLAIAMNELGAKSNTGEGGEHVERFRIGADGKNRNSAIKQVASARFGVTSEYLVSAKEIQIKMAQGAKPGEGGHLPGNKVYPAIAATRFSTPGVGLISPPPHHDIYSIEDLAQLIYDLKSANSSAAINVKLVSEAGVGTIAAGVAKAGAEVILISGFDGGTGAAPMNSVAGAGLPWELGLAEAHQTLIMNGLRSRVKLETDGKLMTGRDVAIAALLGAEEFGFATLPMVSMGCVMMRVCNRDSCPVGVATQNPELRKRFRGKPEHVKNCMLFIAEELREYMAKLGFRTVEEMVGRTDMLRVDRSRLTGKARYAELESLLENPFTGEDVKKTYRKEEGFDFKISTTKDETVLYRALKEHLDNREPAELSLHVDNMDRAFGTVFGSRITKLYGNTLEDDTYHITCEGTGGQSFGAFIPKGLTLELCGDSNDYIGKGLSGGTIIVYPPKNASFRAEDNIIIGNVALYGATSGKLFVNGVAGERFCVRNSGATAVVEGVGNHGIEYMTGGRVVILGPVGENLAAGMSGGIAYVLDEENDVYRKLNRNMVSLEKVERNTDVAELKGLIEEHVRLTGSEKGRRILRSFEDYLPKFKKIMPHDYRRMLDLVTKYEQKGLSSEQAIESAFYEYEGGAH